MWSVRVFEANGADAGALDVEVRTCVLGVLDHPGAGAIDPLNTFRRAGATAPTVGRRR